MQETLETKILKGLQEPNKTIRLNAIGMLVDNARRLEHDTAVRLAKVALQDKDPECRAEAMPLALTFPELQEDIFRIATSSDNPDERETAFQILFDIFGVEDERIFELAMRDKDPAVRAAALDRLESFIWVERDYRPSQKIISLVLKALQGTEYEQESAARIVAYYRNLFSSTELARMLLEECDEIRSVLMLTLKWSAEPLDKEVVRAVIENLGKAWLCESAVSALTTHARLVSKHHRRMDVDEIERTITTKGEIPWWIVLSEQDLTKTIQKLEEVFDNSNERGRRIVMIALMLLSEAIKQSKLWRFVRPIILKATTDNDPRVRAMAICGIVVLWKKIPLDLQEVIIKAIEDKDKEVRNSAIYAARFCVPSCDLIYKLVGVAEELSGEEEKRALASLWFLVDARRSLSL